MKELSRIISKNIKNYRMYMLLTQEQLHEKSGVQRSWISAYENFERSNKTPSIKTLLRLSKALGIEITDLLEKDSHLYKINAEAIKKYQEINHKYLENLNCFYEQSLNKKEPINKYDESIMEFVKKRNLQYLKDIHGSYPNVTVKISKEKLTKPKKIKITRPDEMLRQFLSNKPTKFKR